VATAATGRAGDSSAPDQSGGDSGTAPTVPDSDAGGTTAPNGAPARGGRLPRSARRKQLMAAAQEVFVANGYFDLATPYLATEYTFNHLQLDPALTRNIRLEHYESGHMVYIHKPSLLKMTSDVAAFYQSALPEK